MRKAFCKTRVGSIALATAAALGMALALSGCPVRADNRSYDMGGPGDVFGGTGQQPAGTVTITFTGVPAEHNGRNVMVKLLPTVAPPACRDCACEPAPSTTTQPDCSDSCACDEEPIWGDACVCSNLIRIVPAGTVANGSFTVTWHGVSFPRNYPEGMAHNIVVWFSAGTDPAVSPATFRLMYRFIHGDNPVAAWSPL